MGRGLVGRLALASCSLALVGCAHTATLSITSRPAGASVWVDGQPVGPTPVRLVRTGATTSRVVIRVAHPGLEPVETVVEPPLRFGVQTVVPGVPGSYGLDDEIVHVDLVEHTATVQNDTVETKDYIPTSAPTPDSLPTGQATNDAGPHPARLPEADDGRGDPGRAGPAPLPEPGHDEGGTAGSGPAPLPELDDGQGGAEGGEGDSAAEEEEGEGHE